MIVIFNSLARVLFASGASHSFIFARFTSALGLRVNILENALYVVTSVGGMCLYVVYVEHVR